MLNGAHLKHDPKPVYIGVTLDRTLSYREHLFKTASKLKTRNNLLTKLVKKKSKLFISKRTLTSKLVPNAPELREVC